MLKDYLSFIRISSCVCLTMTYIGGHLLFLLTASFHYEEVWVLKSSWTRPRFIVVPIQESDRSCLFNFIFSPIQILWKTIQWTFLPSELSINLKRMWMKQAADIEEIGFNVKTNFKCWNRQTYIFWHWTRINLIPECNKPSWFCFNRN